ncbi:unnamed protein product, partial [Pylaiella littoralis]
MGLSFYCLFCPGGVQATAVKCRNINIDICCIRFHSYRCESLTRLTPQRWPEDDLVLLYKDVALVSVATGPPVFAGATAAAVAAFGPIVGTAPAPRPLPKILRRFRRCCCC